MIFLGCPLSATCLCEGDFGLPLPDPMPWSGDLGSTWRTGDMSKVLLTLDYTLVGLVLYQAALVSERAFLGDLRTPVGLFSVSLMSSMEAALSGL